MCPNWERLLETSSEDFWREVDVRTAEAREWGFPQSPEEFDKSPKGELLLPVGVFCFSEIIKQPCCKHRTVRELRKFLKAGNYPPRFSVLQLVTEAGYKQLLERQRRARREAHARRGRERRQRRHSPSTPGARRSSPRANP
jgi:hypothetical protein